MVVMVDHGSHRTVYANLSRVSLVQMAKTSSTGQALGLCSTLGNGHRAHFEVWDAEGSAPLEPRIMDCPMKYASLETPIAGKHRSSTLSPGPAPRWPTCRALPWPLP